MFHGSKYDLLAQDAIAGRSKPGQGMHCVSSQAGVSEVIARLCTGETVLGYLAC